MIEFKEISKTYKYKNKTIHALDGISFNINSKDFVYISGDSGSGKTTLLNIIGGITNQTSGKYLFNNKEICNSDISLSKFRLENIGYILQHYALISNKSVIYNIGLPLHYKGINKDKIKDMVKSVANSLNIYDKLYLYPNMLSGGECQRVAIARAIINNPKIILADEPTSYLDIKNKIDILNILSNLNQNGITIIITSHDSDISTICNKRLILNKGKLL